MWWAMNGWKWANMIDIEREERKIDDLTTGKNINFWWIFRFWFRLPIIFPVHFRCFFEPLWEEEICVRWFVITNGKIHWEQTNSPPSEFHISQVNVSIDVIGKASRIKKNDIWLSLWIQCHTFLIQQMWDTMILALIWTLPMSRLTSICLHPRQRPQ